MADAGAADPIPSAASAGRACQVVEYGLVNPVLSTAFDTAGGGQADQTYACVLTQVGADRPQLTFLLTPSDIDVLLFSTLLKPSGASDIGGLGRAAFEVDGADSVEIDWLSARSDVDVLRLALAPGQSPATVGPTLIQLAHVVEQEIIDAGT